MEGRLSKTRVAVVGAGRFGRNHIRVVRQSERADAEVDERQVTRAAVRAERVEERPGDGLADDEQREPDRK